jgi:hypothetical protein
MKTCPGCKVEKPFDDYGKHRSRRDGLQSYCRQCTKEKKNPSWSQKYELKGFNLTLEEYKQMLEERNGLCDICKNPERIVDKRTGMVRNLAVDHCYKTSKVRGLLCYRCNRGIGLMQDDPVRLRAAANYLTGSPE